METTDKPVLQDFHIDGDFIMWKDEGLPNESKRLPGCSCKRNRQANYIVQ